MIDTQKPIFADDGRSIWAERIPTSYRVLPAQHADGLDSHGDEDDSEMEAGYEVDAAGTYTG